MGATHCLERFLRRLDGSIPRFCAPRLHPPCAGATLDPAAAADFAGTQGEGDGGTVDYQADKGQVDRLDMGTGWACFLESGTPPNPEQLPLYLSKTVAAWQKQNSMLIVRTTLPIVANGNTIAVHVWFE